MILQSPNLNLLPVYLSGCILTAIAFLVTVVLSKKMPLSIKDRTTDFILFFSLTFYIISIFYLFHGKINALHHYADFATHLEILWNNYQGMGLVSFMSKTHHGGEHWFSAHFTPIIFLTYVPLFNLFPSIYTIHTALSFFLLSSLVPLWLLSNEYLDKSSSKLILSSFLFYPTIFYINLYGTAYIELSIPLLLWLFYFYKKNKNLPYLIILFLCLMVREEVSLVLVFFGAYLFYKKKIILGIFTTLISVIYFYLIFFVVMPSFTEFEQISIGRFESYGSSFAEFIKYIFYNPISILMKIFQIEKIGNLIIYLVPLFFTPILSPFILLTSFPNLFIILIADSPSYSSYMLYYLSPFIAIIFYASLKSISFLDKKKFLKKSFLINGILVASISSTIFFGATPLSISYWNKNYKLGNFYTTDFHKSAYVEEENDKSVKKLIKLIPDNAKISAEQHILPLLYNKQRLYIFPYVDEETNFILIDKNSKTKTGFKESYLDFRYHPEKYYQNFFLNPDWKIVKDIDGVVLLAKIDEK